MDLSETECATAFGVEKATILEWDCHGAPVITDQYLMLWSCKHLGENWQGWTIKRGKLHYKRMMFCPKTIISNRLDAEKLYWIENENRELKTWNGIARTAIQLTLVLFRKSAASGFVSREISSRQ